MLSTAVHHLSNLTADHTALAVIGAFLSPVFALFAVGSIWVHVADVRAGR